VKVFRGAVQAVVNVGGPAQTIPCDQLLRLCDSHEQLRADLAAARSLLRDAQQDTERLDWLISHSYYGRFAIEFPRQPGREYEIVLKRAAIDVARKHERATSTAPASLSSEPTTGDPTK
jgi:CDP-glycerol glycerophosphotransferase (TagB/SpsB family)